MARGGRGSTTTSSRGGVFGRSSAPSAPAPAPARAAPAPAAKPQAQAPPQQAAPQMQQPTSSGSGFFGTLAASAAGSMVGNVVANKLFGGSSSEQALPQTQRAIDEEMGACASPFKTFLKCVEQNEENIGSCQWNYGMYAQCRQQQQQQM